MSKELNIIQNKIGDVIVLNIEGKLDAKTAPELLSVLSTIIGTSTKIVCNLEKLNYIASAGIGIFLKFLQEAKSKKGDLVLVNLQKQVKDVFDVLKFTSLFKIYTNTNDAIKHFS